MRHADGGPARPDRTQVRAAAVYAVVVFAVMLWPIREAVWVAALVAVVAGVGAFFWG